MGENLVECQVLYLCSEGPKPAQAKAVPHGDKFSGQGLTEEGLGNVLVLIQLGIGLQTVPNFHQPHGMKNSFLLTPSVMAVTTHYQRLQGCELGVWAPYTPGEHPQKGPRHRASETKCRPGEEGQG